MRAFLRFTAVAVILMLPIVYSSCGDGGGGGTGPGPAPAETLASFELTVPDSIAEGEAFPLTIRAVGNRGTTPLISYSGTVNLTTTLGAITPASLTVSNGTGAGQVTLSDPGQQTLAASGGGRTGSVGVQVTDLPDPTIPGDPNATLEQAVQDSTFLPNPDDYTDDHPDFPGIFASYNVVGMAFQVGTTVAEANALLDGLEATLLGAVQGVPDSVSSVLFLRLATDSHAEMEEALATIRSDNAVLHAVQDALLMTGGIPKDNGGDPADWVWESNPNGGNWGLELSRVPQMWSLNERVPFNQRSVSTGVLDAGFAYSHPDLEVTSFGFREGDSHGAHVAGIIGAKFNNARGVDRVNPYARLIVMANNWESDPTLSAFDNAVSWGAHTTLNLVSLVKNHAEIRVINISLGYPILTDTNANTQVQIMVKAQGALLATTLKAIDFWGWMPLVTAATANNSNRGFGLQLAKYANPYCNAAFDWGMTNILCVENVEYAPGTSGEAKRHPSSNIGGHISAPGTGITSTVLPATYGIKTGTSMAAPFVAGLIGYMLAVDPTLTIPEIRNVLFDTAIPVGGDAMNRVDAWAAVMDIDRVQGNDEVLRMMLDIDDGTPDGNQRVDYEDQPDFPDYDETDADIDGMRGDGEIDMSDFRVWRDWFLILEDHNDLALDGELDHLKHDVNGNSDVDFPAQEKVYPRGDFNGDGKLSLQDKAFVPGAIQDDKTDLEVLQEAFDDPDYAKEELENLVYSVDIRVDASTLFDLMGVPSVQVWILDGGGPPPPWTYPVIQSRTILPDSPEQILTVPHTPDGVRVEIDVGPTLSFGTDAVQVGRELGADISVRPIYGARLPPRATYTSTCDDPGAQDAAPIVLADWGIEPGDIVIIDQEGFYKLWEGGPSSEELQAVFSTSNEIEKEFIDLPGDNEGDPPKKLVRRTVTGAIEAGNNVYTSPPYSCENQVANIPQDFSITPHAVFEVPDGATHLFIAARDIFYEDNQQEPGDPLEVSISAIYAPEWEPRINRVSRRR